MPHIDCTCQHCFWWSIKKGGRHGDCCRYPAVVTNKKPTDFCGEMEPRIKKRPEAFTPGPDLVTALPAGCSLGVDMRQDAHDQRHKQAADSAGMGVDLTAQADHGDQTNGDK